MPVEVILPKVDMDMATGRISRWYVENGARVTKGDVLFEIETDKAAMEIDAPASGTIRDIVGQEGIDIPVGEAVAWIYVDGETVLPRPGVEGGAAAKEPAAAQQAPPLTDGSEPPVKPIPGLREISAGAWHGAVRATPLARRIAVTAGLKLDMIAGSGPNGRIMRQDVERAIARSGEATPAPSIQAAPAPRRAAASGAAPLNHVWLREGTGRPFVLIHGFGSDLNSWRPMLAAGAVDAPVLALDLPGHGGSPRSVPVDIDAIAADIELTLAAAGIGQMTLVGHSFGGAIATAVAARGRADVRALALLAPAGLGPAINGGFLTGLVRARSEASLVPWLRLLVANEKFLTPAFVRATLAQTEDKQLRDVQAEIAERFFADGTQTMDVRGLIGGLSMPARVIVGASDRIIPAQQAQGLPGQVALHVFQATGHMPQLEQAKAVLDILLEMGR